MKNKLLLLTLPLLLTASGCSDNKCLLDYKLKVDKDRLYIKYDVYRSTKKETNDAYYGVIIEETNYRWKVYPNYYILIEQSKVYNKNKVFENITYEYYYDTSITWTLNGRK